MSAGTLPFLANAYLYLWKKQQHSSDTRLYVSYNLNAVERPTAEKQ